MPTLSQEAVISLDNQVLLFELQQYVCNSVLNFHTVSWLVGLRHGIKVLRIIYNGGGRHSLDADMCYLDADI